MRIGFDMLAVQSPHHGARGIGRYSANLVASLLARDDDHEYVLYVHDDLPKERVPGSSRAEVRTIRLGLGTRRDHVSVHADRLCPVQSRRPRLRSSVVLIPFEKWASYTAPARPEDGPKMAAVVYDLIPFLFQNEMHVSRELMRQYHVLETITRYDTLLAISESTRRDCLSGLRLPSDRVVNISGASDPRFFVPDRSAPTPVAVASAFKELGIDRPFVLNVGGLDDRKNTWKLIDAYNELPPRVRDSPPAFVLTFAVDYWGREARFSTTPGPAGSTGRSS